MEKCQYCGVETSLYDKGVPVCNVCSDLLDAKATASGATGLCFEQTSGHCGQCTELLLEFERRCDVFTRAIKRLHSANNARVPRVLYERLRMEIEDARRACESARVALATHRDAHNGKVRSAAGGWSA